MTFQTVFATVTLPLLSTLDCGLEGIYMEGGDPRKVGTYIGEMEGVENPTKGVPLPHAPLFTSLHECEIADDSYVVLPPPPPPRYV